MQSVERMQRLYARLSFAMRDLWHARACSQFLLKKGWHGAPYERRGTTYTQQTAWTTSLVVSYARPFTISRGWPSFPDRLLRLAPNQKILHNRLLDLRDETFAHTDSKHHSIKPFKLFDFDTDVILEPHLRLTKKECEDVIAIAEDLTSVVSERTGELRAQLLLSDDNLV